MINGQPISSNGGRITYTDPNTNRFIVAALLFGREEASFRAAVLGDMDGNGALDAFDVPPFETALFNRVDYEAAYPLIEADFVGDINGDGVLNAFDVLPFEQLLAGQGFLIAPEAFLRMFEAAMLLE